MGKLSEIILHTTKSLKAAELSGVSRIIPYLCYRNYSLASVSIPSGVKQISSSAFYDCSNLKKLEFQNPSSVEYIGSSAFENTGLTSLYIPSSVTYICNNAFKACPNLTSVNLDDMDPYCKTECNVFLDTPWLSNQSGMVFGAKGKILIYSGDNSAAGSYQLPNTVINLAECSCNGLVVDSTLVIPDHVVVVGGEPLLNADITKIIVSSSIYDIPHGFVGDNGITTMIFRQPAGMKITLPTPGDGTGIAYNKNSRTVSIYTDNEDIRNYDWATDNVTATFYPLSQAPA